MNSDDRKRRQFLTRVGGVAAASLAAGTLGVPLVGGTRAEAAEVSPDQPNSRLRQASRVRNAATRFEEQLGIPQHPTNGDEERYSSKMAVFTKGLPHNDLGEVDLAAYNALLCALQSGKFEDVEAVPLGGTAKLGTPLGGLAFSIQGADPAAVPLGVPPTFASRQQAAEMAELYWIAYLRDTPYSDYAASPAVAAACADLQRFGSDYKGPRINGQVTPQTLFRDPFPGCLDGPFVSQLLLRSYRFNGVPITQQVRSQLPTRAWQPDGSFTFTGVVNEFVLTYTDWLRSVRGIGAGGAIQFDPMTRFNRCLRDNGQNTAQDAIYSPYFAAALILQDLGNAALSNANPYKTSLKQANGPTFGLPHLLGLLGSVNVYERHAWYQKWFVHRRLRPETFGGRVHNLLTGAAQYPVHPDLLNSPVLELTRAANAALSGQSTYLLPHPTPAGAPMNPAYPSGHSISAGACITLLKAWFKDDFVIPNPVKPNRDGTALEPYVAGVDGPPLTIGGELNKLAANVSLGRSLYSAHFRSDVDDGVVQGEAVAIRFLQEARDTYPEPFTGFSLKKFDGTTIVI